MNLRQHRSLTAIARRLVGAVPPLFALLPMVSFAQDAAAPQPDLISASGLATSGLRVLVSLALVLGLFALSAWGMRRWRERYQPRSGPIEVVSGLSLGSKERVVLLRVGTEKVLVGLSPAGMRRLHVLGESSQSPTFRERLEAVE